MNNPVAPIKLVTCPACRGQKEIAVPTSIGGHNTTKMLPCMPCLRTGEVNADRVCAECGHFIQSCSCPRPMESNVRVLKLAAKPQPADEPVLVEAQIMAGRESLIDLISAAQAANLEAQRLRGTALNMQRWEEDASQRAEKTYRARLIASANAAVGESMRFHDMTTNALRLADEADQRMQSAWSRVDRALHGAPPEYADAIRHLLQPGGEL